MRSTDQIRIRTHGTPFTYVILNGSETSEGSMDQSCEESLADACGWAVIEPMS